MLLDKFVPEYDFGEVHSTRLSVPPERALEEIKLVNLGEMPLVRLLFAVRSIPAYVGRKRGLPSEKAEPLYEQMLEFGFVLLAEEPGRELVFGGIGQMYKASGGLAAVFRDADDFVSFGKPGYAKVATNFSAGCVDGDTELRTSDAVRLLDGLSGVLDAEGVRAAHVLGPSYGGLVAQCFVRRHPGRVRTLILANTAVPPRRLLWPAKVFLALLTMAPLGWQRRFRERTLARAFSGVPSVPPEDQSFWRDYQHGLVSRLTREDLRSMYRLQIDLLESFQFEPRCLAYWPGRVLILESDQDIVTPEQRAELRRCYPRAVVHTFRGAGHTPWMSHKEEYLSAVKGFLDQ